MKSIEGLFEEYGDSHHNKTNKLIHWVCVPLIFFSIVGMIASIPAPSLEKLLGSNSPFANWAAILLLPAIGYYLMLSRPISIGMILFSIVCLIVAKRIDQYTSLLWVSVLIFIFAWIVQFIGHKIEGKKPSFLKDIQFLLIGPAWLMHFIYKKLGMPY